MMEKRKFSKTRLGKLVFWLIHIIGLLSVALGILGMINYPSIEKNFLENCDRTREIIKDYICDYAFLDRVALTGIILIGSGVGVVLLYWLIRWLYNYLYPKTS